MPSIRQLARIAGVSHSTVSRALRDDPLVAELTRARIRALAEEHNFAPHGHYRLTGGKTSIGYITHQHVGPFRADILQGALAAAYATDINVVVIQTTADDAAHCSPAVADLIQMGVKGVILAAQDTPFPRSLLLAMHSAGVFPVGIGHTTFTQPIDRVKVDHAAAIQLRVDYLWSLGHRAVAYIGPQAASQQELRMLKKQLSARNISLTALCIANLPSETEAAFDACLSGTSRPTALIVENDLWAWPLLRTAAIRGVAIPGDVSVISAGHFYPDYIFPELTTIELHAQDIGKEAIALLQRRITEQIAPAAISPEIITVKPELVMGKTCGLPAMRV